jgi:hypothetical protein
MRALPVSPAAEAQRRSWPSLESILPPSSLECFTPFLAKPSAPCRALSSAYGTYTVSRSHISGTGQLWGTVKVGLLVNGDVVGGGWGMPHRGAALVTEPAGTVLMADNDNWAPADGKLGAWTGQIAASAWTETAMVLG